MFRVSQVVVALVFALLLAGCLPIELSVHDGNVVIPRAEGYFVTDLATGKTAKLHTPGNDKKPAFVVYAPDGRRVLAFQQIGGGGMGQNFSMSIIDAANGKVDSKGAWQNVTYARWSPSGQAISLTKLADKKHEPLDENMPELFKVDPKTGQGEAIARNVSALHRWMPDSKRVLVFQIDSKDEEGGLYRGHLALIDTETGESQKLVAVAGTKALFFDLAPDGSQILFTAMAAGKVGEQLNVDDDQRNKIALYGLMVESKALQHKKDHVTYAIHAPDGEHTLIVEPGDNKNATLSIASKHGHGGKQIADDTLTQIGSGFGPSADVYATWVDHDTIIYLARKAVYGTEGKNLHLVRIDIDGSNKADLQADIDNAAIR